MEQVFTKLIDEFINGKLSRRGVDPKLGCGVRGGGVNPRMRWPRPAPANLRRLRSITFSYQCTDYAPHARFLCEELRHEGQPGQRQAVLPGCSATTPLLVRTAAAGGKTPPFIDHIALTIKDYGPNTMSAAAFKADNAAVGAALEALGNKGQAGCTELSWMVTDPDGFNVQVAPELMHPGSSRVRRGARADGRISGRKSHKFGG